MSNVLEDELDKCIQQFLDKSTMNKKDVLPILTHLFQKHDIIKASDLQILQSKKNAIDEDVDDKYSAFAKYFHYDLTSFTNEADNSEYKPLFRSNIVGGYAMKLLLEHKYKIMDKIDTKDIDINVSIKNSLLTAIQVFKYLVKKCRDFVDTRSDSHLYKITTVDLNEEKYNNITKYFIISISYDKTEFVDIVINNKPISSKNVDKELTQKTLFPLQKENEIVIDLMNIIYMENVLHVNYYAYLKRNMSDGKLPQKGVNDVLRLQLLCKHVKIKSKLKKYCNMINKMDIDELKKMNRHKRSKLFQPFKISS